MQMVLYVGCQQKVDFLYYDGTVKALPCLSRRFCIYTDGDNLGINLIQADVVYSAPNSLYTEINWFYPKSGSDQIDRCVTYNYQKMFGQLHH